MTVCVCVCMCEHRRIMSHMRFFTLGFMVFVGSWYHDRDIRRNTIFSS